MAAEQLTHEPGLADSRFTDNEAALPHTCPGSAPTFEQHLQFLRTADEFRSSDCDGGSNRIDGFFLRQAEEPYFSGNAINRPGLPFTELEGTSQYPLRLGAGYDPSWRRKRRQSRSEPRRCPDQRVPALRLEQFGGDDQSGVNTHAHIDSLLPYKQPGILRGDSLRYRKSGSASPLGIAFFGSRQTEVKKEFVAEYRCYSAFVGERDVDRPSIIWFCALVRCVVLIDLLSRWHR